MKKLTIIIVALIFVTVGCKPRYEQCGQPSEIYEIPTLDRNGYNSCKDVWLNYAYGMQDSWGYQEQYPYPYELGDTIRVSGFIRHAYGKPFEYRGNLWKCEMLDDSLNAMDESNHKPGILRVVGKAKNVLTSIDDQKRCYVTGVMSFDNPFPGEGISEWCYYTCPLVHVVEINN